MGRAFPPEVKKLLTKKAIELRKRGWVYKRIGTELNISGGTAFDLIAENVPNVKADTINEIRKLRTEKGKEKSYAEVSAIIGLGKTTVRNLLLKDDQEKEEQAQSRIHARAGLKGSTARWDVSEEEHRATVLKERKTKQKRQKRKKKIFEPIQKKKREIPNALAYCRVSTEEQAREGMSLAMQQRLIGKFIEAKEWHLMEIITDPGRSAKDLKRPGLKKVIELCKSGEVDIVIIYKLDRLSRRVRDIIDLVEEVFQKNNVDLASVTETIDTSTAVGRGFFLITSVFGQMERERGGERTSDARADRQERGFSTGRLPYGFEKTKIKGKIISIPEKLKHYDLAKDIYDKGGTLKTIQDKFGVKPGTARRLRDTDRKELMKKLKPFLLNDE